VESGGGVQPDVLIVDEEPSKIAIALYSKNYFFDYGTVYAKEHKTIPSAGNFSISATEFDGFVKWLEGKDYSYRSQTETALDSLRAVASREKYGDAIKTELAALQSRLGHDKKGDLLKHKEEIRQILEGEIVSRYYYQRGRIESTLRYDEDLKKAVGLIEQPAGYQALLVPKK
jgi:carboxyl-terminal processing protease